MYLIDTNICIYSIKNKPESVVQKIKSIEPYQIKISSITVAELEYGAAKSIDYAKNKNTLIKFLSAFDIIPFTDSDADVYGHIRATLEKKGKIIGPYDLQIAAQAISNNLILVSNNTKEFIRVPNLKLENWI
ncbi:type II toxin-antitoxin system tRNA(fMet)-specific endonuclease VapC [Leptospira kanakyensis]|uniref:type II toxin-antitoxin system tRNA(fMet)-specific endonuclease VapC n=1 Tax=Leptospira kanakyensis TaxID=2484968 RepID=UPI00223DC009|nr:type II toxin-antitoxin system VapC family toxin [Leptospira kanakyensis]MCW7471554.1 type II toxin-antitoxin system VapC family toxin [Leptospira kanakyensis]